MQNPQEHPSEIIVGLCSRAVEMVESGNLDRNEDPIQKIVDDLPDTELMDILVDALKSGGRISNFFIESLPPPEGDGRKISVRAVLGQVACELIYNEAGTNLQVYEYYEGMHVDGD